MRERVDLGVFGSTVNAAEAGKGVLAVDVHGARPADALSARPTESQRRVDVILNFDERIENLYSFVSKKKGVRIRIRGGHTMGPVWLRSIVYDCRVGFLAGSSGF